ncbi:hypothetical protein E2K80_05630 [Rhodophyticola sp. CCM32]|uniref:beta family protein n=1 Tax=Rhodophyticola sp. CCM32 TaxID=2916397 RepID=UPI00107F19B0|nr:beta family protein [Rhodophyticola sp. CCM32]QBY00280.1 hypothetical protein E2K80_05630 [Rhodophyticola sp. CCM32]
MALERVSYVPTLAIRASEMRGLEFLPLATKERMTPCVLLAPWSSTTTLGKAIDRFETAFPKGDYFLDIDRGYIPTNPDADAQVELASLKNPANAYASWCEFVQRHEKVMPCLQLRDQNEDEIRKQIQRYREFGRTFALRIFRDREPINLEDAISAVSAFGAADFVIILEGGWARDALQLPAWFSGIIGNALAEINAQVPIVASCTTMPKGYSNCVGRTKVGFSNRVLVQQVQANRNDRKIVYGDWGSTRPREQTGGGGHDIPERIDYPTEDSWYIYRKPDPDWTFQKAAKMLTEDAEVWNGKTGQWGEQMIAETKVSKHLGITSLQKNVSVRVNLHLHRQAFYGTDLPPMEALEDDWED